MTPIPHNERGQRFALAPTMDWPAARTEHAPSRSYDVIGRPVALVAEGSTVQCRDGAAGRVAAVLMYDDRGYPTHLVVRHGRWRPRLLRVPFGWVTAIAPDQVVLGLSKHELLQHPLYRTDDELADEATHAFHSAESFHACPSFVMVGVDVRHGVVTLRGNVHTNALRQHAEQIVAHIEGVLAIRNRLRTDEDIVWQADWTIRNDRRLHVHQLQLDACLGLLQLRGHVASAEQRSLAAELAMRVPGVHAVRNNLQVQAHLAPAQHLHTTLGAHVHRASATAARSFASM